MEELLTKLFNDLSDRGMKLQPTNIENMIVSSRLDITLYLHLKDPLYQNYIYADRTGYFHDPSKCLIKLPFYNNREQLDYLVDRLYWLASDDGRLAAEQGGSEEYQNYPEDKNLNSQGMFIGVSNIEPLKTAYGNLTPEEQEKFSKAILDNSTTKIFFNSNQLT
jgi:hypothetical protein